MEQIAGRLLATGRHEEAEAKRDALRRRVDGNRDGGACLPFAFAFVACHCLLSALFCVLLTMCACVRASVRACVRACACCCGVRACVRASMWRACVRASNILFALCLACPWVGTQRRGHRQDCRSFNFVM
jgi:hypothetical protein